MILDAIRRADPTLLQSRDVQIGRLAAAYHDTVQGYEAVETPDGAFSKTMRKRFMGPNEQASAQEALEYMATDQRVFGERDMRIVREAIDATVPAFDPESKTIIQPNLTNNSNLVVLAVALADIGGAGMDGPDAHLADGDTVFREDNLDITELIREKAPLSAEQKEYFRSRMLAWTNSQTTFAEGRYARLETELAAIPESARDAVKVLFDKFEETIHASQERVEKRSAMTFEDLARDFGYEL